MQPLDRSIRNILERTVKEARDTAESAARIALEQLGVGEPSAYPHLSDAERKLRRKLRAHGRQLGNGRDAKGHQALDRLIEEIAYEHWHRMLFARFLAENDLLMYPDPDDPVAVTLEECEDLAADEGAGNGWELASRYASRMLPQIFRSSSPVFQVILPPENQQKLERLVVDLPIEIFSASDSLGWVYQFWQTKKKDEVNASEVKIGARELPAVTQLFTEPYMVSFLLDNSLGAWWGARRLTKADLESASNEDELRGKAAIPGVPLEYLRFVREEGGTWTPASGTFDRWPNNLSELKTIDPSCGSGHFLVAAFLMLVPMRMELEGLSTRDAVDSVLRENIHGLELDKRCVELAAFALALTAWKYPDAGGYRPLPELNIACSGVAISHNQKDWIALASNNTNLRIVLEELYDQFKDAPVLGSLINPEASLSKNSLFELIWEEIVPLLRDVLPVEVDDEKAEMGVAAYGLLRAATLLAGKYQLVFTNPPYLKRGMHNKVLKSYIQKIYNNSKNDLATTFIQRCLELSASGGCVSLVVPHNWLFLTSYTSFRKQLLRSVKWKMLALLGLSAFQTPLRVSPILISLEKDPSAIDLSAVNQTMFGATDVSKLSGLQKKKDALRTYEIKLLSQSHQIKNPDSRILLSEVGTEQLLNNFAESSHGQGSFDDPRFTFYFWELESFNNGWIKKQSSARKSILYDGCSYAFRWQDGKGDLFKLMEAKKKQGYTSGKWMAGTNLFGTVGLLANQMGAMPVTLYLGSAFDANASVISPKNDSHLLPVLCFCFSDKFRESVREIDQELKVTCKSLVKVSFDLDRWTKVAEDNYPNGLPNPFSNDPTQWIFHGHPCGSVVWDENAKWTSHGPLRIDDTVLHIAVPRLLGYRWPAELDENMELAKEQREWVTRCEALLPYSDDDGIVCIPPVRGEPSAADRLLNMLAVAFGDAWSGDILTQLLKSVDHSGKTLETWLRDKFFIQHCKLLNHRPFIWHIWDGLRDGFSVLVNYHKLDHKNLETMIYTYLGDWINRQTQDVTNSVDGAQERLAAAEGLKKKLELILEGETPYDIFVRWKPIEKQPIGWSPDLNDGVRLNIRPFLTVADVKKKGVGVLKYKPNIKWSKDRGKDVESAPWYPMFKGERINDYHLSLSEKKAARLIKKSEAN